MLHFALWCIWYLEHDWNKFILRRFRMSKGLDLDEGKPKDNRQYCKRTYDKLIKENFENTIKRWINLKLY